MAESEAVNVQEVPPTTPKRRGRPPKAQQKVADLQALLASMEAKLQEAHAALQQAGTQTVVLTPEEKRRMEWEEFSRKDVEWQSQQPDPCPYCGQFIGYNPVTGIQVRSWMGRKVVDGHRDACPLKDKSARKVI